MAAIARGVTDARPLSSAPTFSASAAGRVPCAGALRARSSCARSGTGLEAREGGDCGERRNHRQPEVDRAVDNDGEQRLGEGARDIGQAANFGVGRDLSRQEKNLHETLACTVCPLLTSRPG